jgi:hypothetical protein
MVNNVGGATRSGGNADAVRNRRAGVVMASDEDDDGEESGDQGNNAGQAVPRVKQLSSRRPGVGQESASAFNTSQESSDVPGVEQRKASCEYNTLLTSSKI